MKIRHCISTIVASAALGACGNTPVDVGFSDERVFSTHREIAVGVEGEDGAVLAGTLMLPRTRGFYAGIVWHFGSDRWSRSSFENSAARQWLAEGIAVFTYDKRGVGASQGECCPATAPGYLELLGYDVLNAARAIAAHEEVDAARVGAFGFSQGGWVVPVAAAESGGDVAFTIIGSGPTVTLGEELLYSELTGENQCEPSGLSDEEIDRRLEEAGPSRFDPVPFLLEMENPGLWIYGERDKSVPVQQSIAILDELVSTSSKGFSYIVIPRANHAWVIDGDICQTEGEIPNILPTIFEWLDPII